MNNINTKRCILFILVSLLLLPYNVFADTCNNLSVKAFGISFTLEGIEKFCDDYREKSKTIEKIKNAIPESKSKITVSEVKELDARTSKPEPIQLGKREFGCYLIQMVVAKEHKDIEPECRIDSGTLAANRAKCRAVCLISE